MSTTFKCILAGIASVLITLVLIGELARNVKAEQAADQAEQNAKLVIQSQHYTCESVLEVDVIGHTVACSFRPGNPYYGVYSIAANNTATLIHSYKVSQ